MFRKDTCFTVLVHYGKDAPGAAIMKVFDIIACSYFPVVGARISGQQDLDHNRFIFVAEDPGHLKQAFGSGRVGIVEKSLRAGHKGPVLGLFDNAEGGLFMRRFWVCRGRLRG